MNAALHITQFLITFSTFVAALALLIQVQFANFDTEPNVPARDRWHTDTDL